MDLSILSQFKVAAETENFTKAAQMLNISQPALSYALKQLQEDIGVSLFTYTGRGVKLNTYGKIYLEYVTDALNSLNMGKSKIYTLISPDTGTIRMSCLYSLGVNLLPYIIRDFKQEHPHVTIELSQFPTKLQLELLREDKVDLCFCTDFSKEDMPGVEKTIILIEDLYLLVNKNHRFANRTEVNLKELEGEDFIAFSPLTYFQKSLEVLFKKVGVKPRIVFESNEDSTVAAFVTAGLGVAVIPPILGVDFSQCVAIKISYPVCQRQLCMAWKNEEYIQPVMKNFRDFVIKWLPKDKKYIATTYPH